MQEINCPTTLGCFGRATSHSAFFLAHEIQELSALPAEQQAEGFLLCWTRKEAYSKARGEGLQIPLNSFDVSLTPGKPARFLRGVDSGWQLFSFLPADGCAGALVFQGQTGNIQGFDFSNSFDE